MEGWPGFVGASAEGLGRGLFPAYVHSPQTVEARHYTSERGD